jgi:hypothetical protein
MARIHVRGGTPLAGYAHAGMRIVVESGDYDARLVEHLFPQGVVPEQACSPVFRPGLTHGLNERKTEKNKAMNTRSI